MTQDNEFCQAWRLRLRGLIPTSTWIVSVKDAHLVCVLDRLQQAHKIMEDADAEIKRLALLHGYEEEGLE